jgi:hypothetical protein
MSMAAAATRPRLFARKNIFNEDATSLPRVDPIAEKALAERNENLRLANQLAGYSSKSYKYQAGGTAPQLFGYPSTGAKGPTGIGYGGATPGERFQFHWNSGTTPFYVVPPDLPRVKVWLVKGVEGEGTRPEEIRAAGENTNLQSHFEAVLMPLPSAIVAGFDSIKGTIAASKKEMTGLDTVGRRTCLPGARIVGPGLEPNTVITAVSGTTVTFVPEAKEAHAEATYEVIGTPWSEGTDKHMVAWCPATNEYWEMWGTGIWAAPKYEAGKAYALHNVVEGTGAGAGKLFECTKAMTSGESIAPPEASHWKEMPCVNGEYKCAYGSYTNEASEWNGICPNEWGAKACGLAAVGGSLTLSDVTRVLRGGKIGHALGLNVICTKLPALAPSIRKGDEKTNLTKIPKFSAKIPASKAQLEEINNFTYLAEGAELAIGNGIAAGTFVGAINEVAKTAQLVDHEGKPKLAEAEHAKTEYEIVNPSAAEAGLKDAVVEGGWFAFNKEFTAAVAGYVRATEPLLYEIHEAIREHGAYVMDRSSVNCSICLCDPRVLGSPYSEFDTNCFSGYTGVSPSVATINTYINNHVPGSWNEPAGKGLAETLEGSNNPLIKLLSTAVKVENFEQLAPRVS